MVDFFAPAPADSPVDSSLLFRILPPFNTKAESPDMIYKATWLTLRTSVSWSQMFGQIVSTPQGSPPENGNKVWFG